MKPSDEHLLVLVTAPDLAIARQLVALALEAGAIACGNLVPGIESHYRWQGKLEQSNEVLLILKTSRASLAHLEEIIIGHHPYDTPEIIALPITDGNARYLDWITNSVTPGAPPPSDSR